MKNNSLRLTNMTLQATQLTNEACDGLSVSSQMHTLLKTMARFFVFIFFFGIEVTITKEEPKLYAVAQVKANDKKDPSGSFNELKSSYLSKIQNYRTYDDGNKSSSLYNEHTSNIITPCINQTYNSIHNCIKEYNSIADAAAAQLALLKAQSAADNSIQKQFTTHKQQYDKIIGHYTKAKAKCHGEFKNGCLEHCPVAIQKVESSTETSTEGKAAALQLLTEVTKYCTSAQQIVQKELDTKIAQARIEGEAAIAGANKIKSTAMWVGAAGVATILYKDHRDEKKDKRRAEALRQEYERGVITLANGEKLNCIDKDTFTKTECRETMFNYCGKKENSEKVGCAAFSNDYCAKEDASQSYCLANIAKNYCNKTGSDNSNSPSCEWLKERPVSCASTPDSLSCLPNVTADKLASACGSFINDPLCQRFQVIGASEKSATGLSPSGQEDSSGTNQSSSSNASTAANNSTSFAALIGGASSTAGSTVTITKEQTNLWGANSNALRGACIRGQLINCN